MLSPPYLTHSLLSSQSDPFFLYQVICPLFAQYRKGQAHLTSILQILCLMLFSLFLEDNTFCSIVLKNGSVIWPYLTLHMTLVKEKAIYDSCYITGRQTLFGGDN